MVYDDSNLHPPYFGFLSKNILSLKLKKFGKNFAPIFDILLKMREVLCEPELPRLVSSKVKVPSCLTCR